jgi:hypothetical protein
VGWLLALVMACVCAAILALAPPAQELQAADIDLDGVILVADQGPGDDEPRGVSMEPSSDADSSDHKALPVPAPAPAQARHARMATPTQGWPQRSEPPPQRPPRALA